MADDLLPLSSGFPDATEAEWLASVDKVLKGRGIDSITRKTVDGLAIHPLYRESDFAAATDPLGTPGKAPYLRGATAAPDRFMPWDIRQAFAHPSPEVTNEELLRDLERGVMSVELKLDCTGQHGIQITTLDDLPRPAGGEGGADATPEPESRPFALLWTSGTSGGPSAVPILASALEASARACVGRLGLTGEDRWYASLSLGHVGGLALVHRAAYAGCLLLVRGQFSAEVLAELIERDGLTHTSLVPTMLARLLDSRKGESVPSTLRCLLIGGAATGGALVTRVVEKGYPVALTYGLTEACSQVATAPPDLVAEKPGTSGLPIDGLELRIQKDGEIYVRGDTVSPGVADEEGWLATGDLGRLDGDGHLWITGRISDRIVTGGATVHPRSVEVVLEALPGVSGAAVVGIPDDVWGEAVVALIVLDPAGQADPKAVMAQARERLSASELPRRIEFVDSFPLTANGKTDRDSVRALFLGLSHA